MENKLNTQLSNSPKSSLTKYEKKIKKKKKYQLSELCNQDLDENANEDKRQIKTLKKRKAHIDEDIDDTPNLTKKRKKEEKNEKKIKNSAKYENKIIGDFDRNIMEKSPVTSEAIEKVPVAPQAILKQKKSSKKREKHKRKKSVSDSQELSCSTEINELVKKEAVSPRVEKDRKKKKSRKIDDKNYNSESSKRVSEDTSIATEHFSAHTKEKKKVKTKKGKVVSVCSSDDSQEVGMETFSWMISPISTDSFFRSYWQKKPLLVQRVTKGYYEDLCSTLTVDKMLRKNNLIFNKNIEILSYQESKRKTCDLTGMALPPVVWDFYNDGCSIRLINPQAFHCTIWKFLSSLQEYFNYFCGANIYLTPPGTQEFAPHWDNKEVFFLQLEGKKRWRVYNPRVCDEVLPREPSGYFDPEDQLGDPVIDCILESGDLLYVPQGFIQQEEAIRDAHSLHITITTYHNNAYVDFFEKLLPAALANAAAEDVNFRMGLPKKYLNFSGIVHSENRSAAKEMFVKHIYDMFNKIWEYCPIEDIADQMAKRFIKDSLPPPLSKDERKCSAFNGGEKWCNKRKSVINIGTLRPDTKIRLLRRGCVRLVVEENSVRLYHSLENRLECRVEDPKYIEVHADRAPAVEALILSYPKYITVESLPMSSLEEKVVLTTMLWESGLITTSEPLIETSNYLGIVQEQKEKETKTVLESKEKENSHFI